MDNSELKISNDQATAGTLLLTKIVAMIVLGIGSLILGILPLVVGRCQTKKKQMSELSSTSSTTTNNSSTTINKSTQGLLTSLLLCFGGGVLLFTTFLHLAPEVRESVERHQNNGQLFKLGKLSMAELLFCIGFFIVYFIEEIVHATITDKIEKNEDLLYRTVSVRRCNNKLASLTNTKMTNNKTTPSPSTSSSTWKIDKFNNDDDSNEHKIITQDPTTINQNDLIKKNNSLTAVFVRPLPPMEPAKNNGLEDDRFVTPENLHSNHHHHHLHHHHHHENHSHIPTHADTSARGLLTVIALSFHAIFEGLAVGLEPLIGSVIYLALAIATHKFVIAFCVGMELYATGVSTKTVMGYLTVFSLVTPIGIMAGLILGYLKNDSDNLGPTPTILQGIATGTLLYVVFFEVLAREKANNKSGLLQLIAIIVGFCVMLGLQLVTAHSHSHGEPEDSAETNSSSNHVF
ncbi:zinc transporter ZIP6-like isoform X1 [Aphidius gifuensis]|nr:zinc transporter ZIP6-like isoform X1 [Aphidius gifuensis]